MIDHIFWRAGLLTVAAMLSLIAMFSATVFGRFEERRQFGSARTAYRFMFGTWIISLVLVAVSI